MGLFSSGFIGVAVRISYALDRGNGGEHGQYHIVQGQGSMNTGLRS